MRAASVARLTRSLADHPRALAGSSTVARGDGDQRFLEQRVVPEPARRVIGEDAPELAPGPRSIAELVARDLGQSKPGLGEALAFVASADARVLAFTEYAFEVGDRSVLAPEAELEPGGGHERVIPVGAGRIGKSLRQREEGGECRLALTGAFEPRRAFEGKAFFDFAAAERALEPCGLGDRRFRAFGFLDALEHASGGARREARVRITLQGRAQ